MGDERQNPALPLNVYIRGNSLNPKKVAANGKGGRKYCSSRGNAAACALRFYFFLGGSPVAGAMYKKELGVLL